MKLTRLPPLKLTNFSRWKFLAVSAAGFALSVTPSFADWTYTAPGTMTGTQDFTSSVAPDTYDMGGSGASINATLNIQSGTLNITADQAILGNGAVSPQTGGTINATGGTLNIINRYWGGGIGFHAEAAGSAVNISGGATVNWDISSQGWSQQRLYIAYGPFNFASASVNLDGGTFAVTSTNSGDSGRGVYVGLGPNATGTINLNTGTFSVAGAIPVGLGGDYSNLDTTATWTDGTGISVMNITDGIFMQTGITLATGLSSTASAFRIGNTSYVNFFSGGTGFLSLEGWDQASFEALVTAGQIKIDYATASISDFSFSTNGAQGQYGLAAVPEPSVVALVVVGLSCVVVSGRRRIRA